MGDVVCGTFPLSVRVLLSRGQFYEDTKLPCTWAAVLPGMQLDAFIWTHRSFHSGQTLKVKPLAYCHVSEDGALSHILLTVPIDENPTPHQIRIYEAKMSRYLNRQFEIVGWGNAPAVERLLALRYNLTPGKEE